MSVKLAKHDDTGWQNLTLLNGFTGNIQVRKKNGIIYFRGYFSTGTKAWLTKLAELPSWAQKPATATYIPQGITGSASVATVLWGISLVYGSGFANADVSIGFSFLSD